jgi:hypothetical protein
MSVWASPKNQNSSSFPVIFEVHYDADLAMLTIYGDKFDPETVEVRLGNPEDSPLPFLVAPVDLA